MVDINGPTICRVLETPDARLLMKKIGPDLLRRQNLNLHIKISASKAQIGRLIMDKSVMAGVGNVIAQKYCGVRKFIRKPREKISRNTFDRCGLMPNTVRRGGVKHNAIITVDKAKPSKTKYTERVNIFGKDKCPKCKGEIINSRLAHVEHLPTKNVNRTPNIS